MDKRQILRNYQFFSIRFFIAKCLLFIFIGSFSNTIIAGVQPQNPPDTQQNLIEDIIPQLNQLLNDEMKPGLLLCIVGKDSVLFDNGLDFADLSKKRRVDKQTLFRMGSITKTFTSLAILSLVAEGKIKLLDELKKIAPKIPFENSWEITNPVRVIHLLEHTAGFDDLHFKAIYNPNNYDLSTLVSAIFFRKRLYSHNFYRVGFVCTVLTH